MKRIIAFISLFTVLALMAAPTYAAEINPDPNTYSYGATSELSPYQESTYTPQSSEELAPTGTNTFVIYFMATILMASGIFVIVKTSRSEL